MYSSTLDLQFWHLKPTGAAPENGRTLLVRRFNVAKAPKADLLRSKPAISLVLSYKGVDPLAKFQIQQVIERQSKGVLPRKQIGFDPTLLREAYKSCRKICAEHSKSYYLGTLLLTEERKKAIWAIYAWCQRTDELVDGANAHITSSTMLDYYLDSWEKRLEDIFDGCPHNILDAALADTVQQFPLDIKPFKDVIKGMRMDTFKTRYENYEELELYCYYVAGTVGLMTVPIAGISPESESSTKNIYRAALSLGIGNQLTNILRDVAEDASMGRVYLPQDELREFGLTDNDIFSKNISKAWREFTKKQIVRARQYYEQAEHGVSHLNNTSVGVNNVVPNNLGQDRGEQLRQLDKASKSWEHA